MRLSGAQAETFCTRPDDRAAALLLHGPDVAHTAEMRRRLTRAVDPDGTALTRLDPGEARRQPATLHDSLRAAGFFAARPIVLITGATDGLAEAVNTATDGLVPGEGLLILEAGSLTAKGKLRRLFEGAKTLLAIGLYPKPPNPPEIEYALAEAGLSAGMTTEALTLMAAQAREMDRGSFARLIETVALMGADATAPVTDDEVAALLPAADAAESEALVRAVMLGHVADAAILSGRLAAAGVTPVTLAIAAGGLLRQLLTASSHPEGAYKGIATLRPPAFGARRDAMGAILNRWTAPALGRALSEIHEMDATLRSAGRRPDAAMMERLLLRLSLSAR
ncbi:MAG: DNA polymerase III subunit delta [Pseudomonadota bacterium]